MGALSAWTSELQKSGTRREPSRRVFLLDFGCLDFGFGGSLLSDAALVRENLTLQQIDVMHWRPSYAQASEAILLRDHIDCNPAKRRGAKQDEASRDPRDPLHLALSPSGAFPMTEASTNSNYALRHLPEPLLREGVTGARFKLTLKSPGILLVRESNVSHQFPGDEFGSVRGFACMAGVSTKSSTCGPRLSPFGGRGGQQTTMIKVATDQGPCRFRSWRQGPRQPRLQQSRMRVSGFFDRGACGASCPHFCCRDRQGSPLHLRHALTKTSLLRSRNRYCTKPLRGRPLAGRYSAIVSAGEQGSQAD